jgi:predicted DCC family thiol-disulfide oxidoreductase YuxK
MEGLPENKKIILFDGVCNLCNSSVQYIIKHDKKDVFRFVAIQSKLGQKIIDYIGINPSIDSIILYVPKKAYYTKANAALLIAKELSGFNSFLYYLTYTPKSIKNYIYDFVAKNRYKWYGKKESCMIPTQAILNKFLL